MSIKALVFDLYGTLVNIRTDEQDPEIYSQISKFLSYNRVFIEPEHLRLYYMEKIKLQLSRSREQYPDVNVLKVFTELMHEFSEGRMEPRLPLYSARLFRAFSRRTFEPFPGIYGMLERLRDLYPLALVSDAQRCYTEPEINVLKLGWFFDFIFLSSDYGFRKPEPKYFRMALGALGVKASDAVYIGDNAFRDLSGAKKAGMKMVLVRSSEREYEGIRPDAYIDNIADLEGVLPYL
jgi:putative hydrolase of the HAD superfamily